MTLHISNLSKRYGNKWVLRDVAFEVEEGRVLGLLGASKSGKSTVLKIIAGRERASPPESYRVPMSVTVEYISSDHESRSRWLPLRGRPGAYDPRKRIRDAAENGAKILLLDDPLCSADRNQRDELIELTRYAAMGKGLMTVYATSDFETIAAVADDVSVLADGYIHQIGSPEQVYEAPLSTAVARLTGRCNVFAARRLTSTRYEIPEFQTIDGGHRLFSEKADVAKLGAINQNVALSIRPENISMSFGASFPEDNLLKAIVKAVKFRGPITVVDLDANGLALEAMVFRLVGLNIGDECMLGLPPNRIRILRD